MSRRLLYALLASWYATWNTRDQMKRQEDVSPKAVILANIIVVAFLCLMIDGVFSIMGNIRGSNKKT